MSSELTISKANSFVQASYSMTLDEMRVLALTLGVFDPENPTKRDFEFTVSEFCQHFPDVNPDIAYTQVQNAIRKISRRWMTLRDDEYVLDEVVFVTDRTYFKKEGRFRIMFHERLMPYISELHGNYTKYQLVQIGAFTSTHSIRLYELCSQYRKTGWRQTSLDDLKDWLQVTGKYDLYANFRKWVLEPAISEINAKSDLLVDVEPIKRGRTIVALKFTIKSKKST
ncbi:replication initiation protein, partial [Avibacterium avium]